MTLDDTLSNLEKLAQSATPGPWSEGGLEKNYLESKNGYFICGGFEDCGIENLHYIIAMENNILRLIETLRLAREALERYKGNAIALTFEYESGMVATEALAKMEEILK